MAQKVAFVHDYIKEYGGAERVLEVLHELYPDAPVFTLVYLPEFLGPHRERFREWDIRTSVLQYLPFKQKLISPFRLLSPWIFQQFDLSEFDVVIVSATGAYFPNMIRTKKQKTENKKGAVQICYCHTPPRYLYGYATARNWKKHKLFAALAAIANHFLRMVDMQASHRVDYYIANSREVAGRIRKFYRRDATVIYPPVLTSNRRQVAGDNKRTQEAYFLTGGRLARAKHTDIIVRACAQLGLPLKIFGRAFAGYEEEMRNDTEIRQLKGNNSKKDAIIEFLGEVSDQEKRVLMQNAKAFIFASEDEDFGIVPVEAMGEGIPVIAYRSGGVLETVVAGKTGIFFDELTVTGLEQAIKQFEKMHFDSNVCRKQAEKFGKERFISEMRDFVSVKCKVER